MAWVGSDFKSKDDIAFDLTRKHVSALEDLLIRLKDVPTEEIVLAQCFHPSLNDDLQKILDEVLDRRGIVLVRGFPVSGYAIEEIEKMYWAFCRHLGPQLGMNSFGHKLVRVQEEKLQGGVQTARGSKSSGELAMHNDAGDLFTLLYVHQAAQGGESQFASGVAVHNTVLEKRPDLLQVLYRGFPYHRRSDQPDHQPSVTPYRVPVFSNNNGRICINFTYSSILPAFIELGEKPTSEEEEAIDLVRQTLLQQTLEIRAESGEMSVVNNYALCHSRSSFVDGATPETRRLVLRFFLEVPPWRRRLPTHLGREFFGFENEAGRLGVDMVPGREQKIARNEYVGVSEELRKLFIATQAKPQLASTLDNTKD
jgi:hypothetical protein